MGMGGRYIEYGGCLKRKSICLWVSRQYTAAQGACGPLTIPLDCSLGPIHLFAACGYPPNKKSAAEPRASGVSESLLSLAGRGMTFVQYLK